MPKTRRFGEAARAVWRRSYETVRVQAWWEQAATAVDALLADLRQVTDEDALQEHYWASGDTPGEVLQRHLTIELQLAQLLELEEACFWLRLHELCGSSFR